MKTVVKLSGRLLVKFLTIKRSNIQILEVLMLMVKSNLILRSLPIPSIIFLVRLEKNQPTNSPIKTAQNLLNILAHQFNILCFFHSITESEITEVISDLKNSNSTGYDEYTIRFIKLSSPLLAPALEKIFDLSLKTGIYPNA